MYSMKQGRGPSILGGVFSIIFAVVAFSMAGMASKAGAPGIFSLVPTLMGIFGLLLAAFSFYTAIAGNRPSTFDITTEGEEDDPFNVLVRAGRGENPARKTSRDYFNREDNSEDTEERSIAGKSFCPFCGEKVEPDFEFCPKCGKDI